jgi:hypothetical protein
MKVFAGLALLTLVFASGAALLSLDGSPQTAKVSDGLLDLTKLCVAGLVGLIGGKTLQ